MYINPFLAGVIATILAEVVLIVVVCIFTSDNSNKK